MKMLNYLYKATIAALALTFFCMIKSMPCPCLHGTSTCFCSEINKLIKVETLMHGAPVQSVAWLCDVPCGVEPHITQAPLAAIGGYQSLFNACAEGASVRVYEFNTTNDHLTETAHANPSPYIYSVNWCCINNVPYLAVAGKPNLQTSTDIWIYKYNVTTKSLELIASASHGATVYAISWLCDACTEQNKRFLAIGGQEAPDKIDIRLLQFDPDAQPSSRLKIVTNRSHGATVFAVDWCTKQYKNPLLLVGGKTVIDDQCEKVNLRLYSVTCQGGMNLLKTHWYKGETIRTLKWCCQKPCPNFPYLFAVGGDPIECCDIIERCGINTIIYALDPRMCQLVELGYQKQQEKIFALDWAPQCKCSHLTAGGGCKQTCGCNYNLFTYQLAPRQEFEEMRIVTRNKFDDIITSMSWCKYGDCAVLLVGSERKDWQCGLADPFDETSHEIALYRAELCTPRPPQPLCCPRRTATPDDQLERKQETQIPT